MIASEFESVKKARAAARANLAYYTEMMGENNKFVKKIGLVVGKFSPLHYGHDFLITKALKLCDELVILSYTSNDWYDVIDREYWLKTLYPTATVVVLQHYSCPPDDAPDDAHRKFCADIVKYQLKKDISILFTSEDYGDGFAEYLSLVQGHYVKHVCVDPGRLWHPVSGTQLRTKMLEEYVPKVVLETLKPKIVILGGESSGKTTLAKLLGVYCSEPTVEEYGRVVWDNKQGQLEFDDMLKIAQKQVSMEREAAKVAAKFIICDTSPLTTYFYSMHLFGVASRELFSLSRRKYQKTILLDNSIPFIQDGTRQNEEFRKVGYDFYKDKLKEYFTPASKTIVGRVQECLRYIYG